MYDDGDDGGGGGCLGLVIIFGIFFPMLKIIGIFAAVILGILLIAWIIKAIDESNQRSAAIQAAAQEKRRLEQEQKEQEERAEQARRERQRIAQELKNYEKYFTVQKDASIGAKLRVANTVLRKLNEETDPAKRAKILAFYDKYLPLVTESIAAAEHGDADLDETLQTFTDAVKAFSRDLYQVDEIVDINKTLILQLAAQDGLLDPMKMTMDDASEEAANERSETYPSV